MPGPVIQAWQGYWVESPILSLVVWLGLVEIIKSTSDI